MFQYTRWWNYILLLVALLIIVTTIWYVNQLTSQIQEEERKKVATWVEANQELLSASDDVNINLATEIILYNTTIPIILVDETGTIIDYRNLDSTKVQQDSKFLEKQLADFKEQHAPFLMEVDSSTTYAIYYGDSSIVKQIRYYPYVQLLVVAFFIGLVLLIITATYRAAQNHLWVGMAKETAHQLGTPLSSMEAWIEILRAHPETTPILAEMGKDVDRLKLISDRFSKIGSVPHLEMINLVDQLKAMIDYIRRRAPQKIALEFHSEEEEVQAALSAPLFDWVIENLLKNALDAMDGTGSITVHLQNFSNHITIDITDTGKGIPTRLQRKIFHPGFSTKKRGWGLGLSLAKRIIEDYHQGRLHVKWSEINKGTTFRIWLSK
jgi:signal transduction histidine kinase